MLELVASNEQLELIAEELDRHLDLAESDDDVALGEEQSNEAED